MEVKAIAKQIRISPKKSRLVVDVIRGMDAAEARSQLKFMRKKAAKTVLKVLESAIANARHNFDLKEDNLRIKKAYVDGGSTLKRWTPRAFGRASSIRKRTSHIAIILEEKAEIPAAKGAKGREKKKPEPAKILDAAPKKEPKKGISGKEEEKPEAGEDIPAGIEDEKTGDIFDARRAGKHRSQQHMDKIGMKKEGGKNVTKRVFRRKSV